MRLYHSRFFFYWVALISLLAGCTAPQLTQGKVTANIFVDGGERPVDLPAGSTVQDALQQTGINLGSLDRSEPSLDTLLNDKANVRIIRVKEEFNVEQAILAFEHQTLKNESIPEGESRLVQPGVNGLQEITYRRVFEDGKEVSNDVVKSVILKEAVPEITMVGSQSPFASFALPGRLVYLLGGNAWVIEGTTANRKPVVTTGDLDGRIFSLSPDGNWLLFTRRSQKEGTINTLWAAKLGENSGQMIDLKASNVVHYADWKPGSTYTIAFSTVEPRASAPGWQANNDLNLISLSSGGQIKLLPLELETNMGGNYGWWGMTFAWSPDGLRMAYARPDGIGLVELGKNSLTQLLPVTSLQTGGDWAWVPGLNWGPDSKTLFSVDHVPSPGVQQAEKSPLFDLAAVPLSGGAPVHLASQSGMFAYPLPSPILGNSKKENSYLVAYLQAIFPNQSESGRYRVVMIDRDGSNRRVIFPEEGAPGLEPQSDWGAWSPAPIADSGNYGLAVIYQKNLWLVDAGSGEARQITGDALIVRVDWK